MTVKYNNRNVFVFSLSWLAFVVVLGAWSEVWAGESNLRTGGKLILSAGTVADGDTFDVTVPILNNGSDETRNSVTGTPSQHHLYVYLGRNPGDLRDVGGTKGVWVPSLQANSSTNVKVSITVPKNWPAGTSYVHAFVDGYQNYVKNETNEDDNYSYVYGHSVPITIVHKRSNLKTQSILISTKTTNLVEDEAFSVDIPIENAGDVETRDNAGNPRSFYVALYINTLPGSLTGATQLAQVTTAPLDAGEKRTVRVAVKIPNGWPIGTSYLHAFVDSYQNYVTNESDETDNYSYSYGHSLSITVGRIRSNLKTQGTMQSSNAKPVEGEQISIKVPVENNGADETRTALGVNATTTRFYVTAYLAPRPGSLDGATSLAGVWVNSLKSGGTDTATINATIPVGTRPGQYWLHAFVDSYQNYVKNESDQTDNYSYTYGHSITVDVLRARSNLRTGGAITLSKTTPNPGEMISYTATALNDGTYETLTAVGGTSRSFYVDFYISQYPGSLSGATHLGRQLTNALGAGKQANVTLFAAIPNNWPQGRSYIHAVVDGYQNYVKNENDEDDNASYMYGHSATVDVGGQSTPLTTLWADLITQSTIKASQTQLTEGQQFTLDVTLKNGGTGETWDKVGGQPTNFSVKFYISRLNNTLDGATALGSVTLPSMKPNDTQTATIQAVIPTGWQEGTSYIHVQLDSANAVGNELDISNNVSFRTQHSLAVDIGYAFSNLRLSGPMVSCQSKVTAGTQICVTVPIGNFGPASTNANFASTPSSHTTRLYISQYADNLMDAVQLTEMTHSALGPGGRISPQIFAILPANWPAGQAYLHAVVDVGNDVKNESNEGDNASYFLGYSAKIDVSRLFSNLKTGGALKTASPTAEVGQQVNLSLNIENNGSDTTFNAIGGSPVRFTVAFYLSYRNNTLEGATAVGTITTDELLAGANRTVTHTFVVPKTWQPGTAYIHAIVDATDVIKNESNEGDNTSIRYGHSTSLTITQAQSNLTTSSALSLSATSIKQEDYVRVVVPVKNTGNAETLDDFGGIPVDSRVDIYLSARADSILGATKLGSATLVSLGAGGTATLEVTVQIPANTPVGAAYIHAVLDAADAVKNESNEGDNYSYSNNHSRSVSILSKTVPGSTNGTSNLKTRSPITLSQSVVVDNETIFVYVPAHNAGSFITANKVNGSPVGFYVRVYLTTDPNSLTNATLLGSRQFGALDGGANLDVSFEVTIPKDWPQGQSYIHSFVDAYQDAVKNETDENDNYSYATNHSAKIRIEHRRSNLRTNGVLTLDRTKALDGDFLKVTVPIINNGSDWTRNSSGALSNHHVYLYISQHPGALTGATQLAGLWVNPLDAQQSTSVELSVQIPKGWAPGTSYIHAFVDGYQNYVRNESNEDDNYSYVYGHSVSVDVSSRRANLRTADRIQTSAASVQDSDYINVQVPVINNGNETTLDAIDGSPITHYVYVYLSKDPGTLTGAKTLGGVYVQALKAGERATATVRVQIPEGWATGTSYIHAFVDGYQNRVKNESDENDNYSYSYGHSATVTIVRKRSNLRTASAITLSHLVRNDGDFLTVTVPIINNGDDATLNDVNGNPRTFYVGVYLAPRAGDLSDAKLLGNQLMQPLQPGERTSAQINVQIPVGTIPAKWYIHAHVDYYTNLIKNESDENDNYSYSYNHSAVLNVSQVRSNLKTSGLLTANSTTYSQGAAVVVTVPFENAGNAETLTDVGGNPRTFYVGVYLSRHPTSLSGAHLVGRVLTTGSLAAGAKSSLQVTGNIPTSTAWQQGGPVYFHAHVDEYANYIKNESDENDNYSYSYGHSVQVTLSGTSGTTPQWSNVKGIATITSDKQALYEGDNLTLSFPIKNDGQEATLTKLGGTTTNFKVRFYIAPNADNLIGAVSLGETSIYAMSAGATETAILQAQLPAAWPSGKTYIHAEIDSGNDIGNESVRSDNLSYFTNHSLTVQVGSRASNLRTAVSLLASPTTVNLGGKVTVSVSVLNNGDDITRDNYNGRSSAFTVDLYISQSANGLTSAVKLDTANFAELGANATSTAQVDVIIPTDWPTQTAYIHAVIDPNNAIKNESNEGDNQSWQYNHSATIQVTTQRSNVLTYKTILLSTSSAAHNDFVTATVYVENNGTDTTLDGLHGNPVQHRVDLYMGRHAQGLQESTKVGSAVLNALAAKAQTSIDISFTIPTTWPEGTTYIHAVLDAGSDIKNESNTGDNYSYARSHSSALQIGRTFSNLVTSATITSSVTNPSVGDFIYVTVKVTNNGKETTLDSLGGTPTASTVYLWLSQWNGNANGTRLGAFNLNAMKAGETQTASFWVQIPATWPTGSAYLHAEVDALNEIKNESNEGDNWSYINNHSLSISVLAAGSPPSNSGTSNLKTGQTLAINNITPVDGEIVTVTVDIFNSGQAVTAGAVNGTAQSFYVDLYISQQTGTITGATQLGRILVQPLAGNAHAIVPFQVKIPTGWSGTAYLHAFVDSYQNRIKNESDENDNYSFSNNHSLTITVGQNRSNLLVIDPIAPSKTTLVAGESFDVKVTIANNGQDDTRDAVGGSTITHHLYLYLSSQPQSTAGSATLAGVYIRSLKAGEKLTHLFQVQVPANWTAGTAYLHAFVDGYQNRVKNESNENDNLSYQNGNSAQVTIGQSLSNLRTGGELVLDQKTVSDNGYVNVTVPVLNNGQDLTRNGISGTARSFYVYVYLGPNNNNLTGAQQLGSVLVDALKPNETISPRVRIRIPENWPTGTSYIHAFVDAYQNYVKNESNENDNYSYVYNHSVTITITHDRSNLKTYAGIYVSNSAPTAGEYIDINVPIENNGNRETLNDVEGSPITHYVYVYLGPNPTSITGADTLGGMYVQSLQPGEKTVAQLLLRIPTNKASGTYYIHAFVDGYQNRVKNESNENDNYSYLHGHSATVYVGQQRSNPRTLGPLLLSATQVKSGDSLQVTVPVINAGSDVTRATLGGNSAGLTVTVYLSSNANSISGATSAGSFNLGAMNAGASSTQTLTVNIPTNLTGNYWVHAHVDSGDTVRNETDENDNHSYVLGHSQPLGINQFRSDLQTNGALSVNNNSPQEGSLVTVTVPVKNVDIDTTRDQVGGNTTGFDTWIYISNSPSSLSGAALVGKFAGTTALAAGANTTVTVPGQLPGGWVGTQYLHAVLNPLSGNGRRVGNERDVNNNTSGTFGHSVPVFIGTSRSNMQFTTKIQLSAASSTPGSSLNVTVSLKNAGNDTTRTQAGGNTEVVQVALYITTNAFSRQGATLLTTLQSSAAPGPNQTLTLQGTFTIPALTQPLYYVHGYIVPAGNEDVVFDNESFQTNHSALLQIQPTPLSDLAFDGKLQPSTSVPYAGQSMTVDVPIKNDGKAPTRKTLLGATTGFAVIVYLGANAADRTGATQVGTTTIAAGLNAGGTQVARVTVTIPANAATGKAYLHAVIDEANEVGNESDRNNNESATTGDSVAIDITGAAQTQRSDLKFDDKLWVSTGSPYPGQTVSVNLYLHNSGNDDTRSSVGGNATGFKVNLYLSTSTNSLQNALSVGLATVATAMTAGSKQLLAASISVPANIQTGTWYLHARIDADYVVGNESNRVNNDSWATNHSVVLNVVTSQQRSDLEIQGSLSLSTVQPFAGQAITVQATLKNSGNDTTRDTVGGNAQGFNVVVYLGTTADGSGTLQQIGTFSVNSPLASQATTAVSISATIPGSWANGAAYVHVVLDPGLVIGNEGNARNNASYNTNQSVLINVTGASNNQRSNLNLKAKPTLTGSLYAGAYVTLEGVVQNTGNDWTRDTVGGNKVDFEVTLYLASQANSVASGIRWKDIKMSSLDANQNQTFKEALRIPVGIQPGTYWVHVVIDEKQAVGNESNRLDNTDFTLSLSMQVGGIADKDGDGVTSDKDCDDSDKNVYPGATEICDGKDNDCDGQIDVGTNLCKTGETCVNGACVSDCNPACGNGFRCKNNLCVEDNCYGLGCPTGQICLNNACVKDPCGGVSCNSGEYCRGGKCIKSCSGVSCNAGEICKEGSCVQDPCAAVRCASGQYCDQGTCQPSQCGGVYCTNGRMCEPSSGKCVDDPCAHMTCPSGQICLQGSCYTDPCQGRCKTGEVCWAGGYCVPNNCYFSGCPVGQLCRNSVCVEDRCASKTCATGEFCRDGQCYKTCAGVTCSAGQICRDGACEPDSCANVSCASTEVCVGGKCITNPCTNVSCQRGQICDVSTGKCIDDPCHVVVCPTGQICQQGSCFTSPCSQSCQPGFVCYKGSCAENNCYTFGCSNGFVCVQGTCVQDPCVGKQCGNGEYCYQGQCIKSCAGVTCNSGEQCVQGQCQKDPCSGVSCKTDEICISGKCVQNSCQGKTCPTGRVCDPATGSCVFDPCALITCPSRAQYCSQGTCYAYRCNPACPTGFVCYKDLCREDNCYTYGCANNQICRNGACVSNPCVNVTCNTGEFCREGQCVKTCAGVQCQSGEMCVDGACKQDPCAGKSCAQNEVCVAGNCIKNPCLTVFCGVGRICDPGTGKCQDSPCAYVSCPADQVCNNGNCYTSPCQPTCSTGKRCVGNRCVDDHCYNNGCPTGQICRTGYCIADPCDGKQCGTGEFCRLGSCIKTCAGVSCNQGELCKEGSCVKDPCAGVSCNQGNQICYNGQCIDDKCSGVNCGSGRVCDPPTGQCVDDPCQYVKCVTPNASCREGNCYGDVCNPPCKAGEKCKAGVCEEDNCYTQGCPTGKICLKAQCEDDKCQGKSCGTREFCRDGNCVRSCADISCAAGEVCKDGKCDKDACAGVSCKDDEFCNAGTCTPSKCGNVKCGKGRICEPSTGQCIDDPCLYVACPSDEVCRQGNCFQRPKAEEEVTSEAIPEDAETTVEAGDGSDRESQNEATTETSDDAGSSEKSGGEQTIDAPVGELPPPPGGCGCQQQSLLSWSWMVVFSLVLLLLVVTRGSRKTLETR